MPKFALEKKKVEMTQENSKKIIGKKVNFVDNTLLREKTRILIDRIESLMK